MIESRSHGKKPVDLPVDFLKMVREVFTKNFDHGLKALSKIKKGARFEVTGALFPVEVVLAVSLHFDEDLAATTIYASSDYDPKASTPTVQDLLALCVDAVGGVYQALFEEANQEQLEQLSAGLLSSMSGVKNIPFQWTPVTLEKRTIHVLMDKANPTLDRAADEWLAKNDPKVQSEEEAEMKETEELFVTGPKKPTVH